MNEDLRDAAIDAWIAIEKNKYASRYESIASGAFSAGIVYYLDGGLALCFMTGVLLTAVQQAKAEILQMLRRMDRSSIFRSHPELYPIVKADIEKMKADKRFWRSLNR